jgi:signal transduction histidine kinase
MSGWQRCATPHRPSEKGSTGAVLVTVRDTGVGLDPVGTDRLFDPFHTTKVGGMGMGLAISRSIIESHGGRIWAGPNSPRGAVFRFALPAEPVS